jgi:cell division protein FtsB
MAHVRTAALICLLLCISSRAGAAEAPDLDELKRAIDALREENRALTQRVLVLEAEQAQREQPSQSGSLILRTHTALPAPPPDRTQLVSLKQRVAALTAQQAQTPPTVGEREELEQLKRRVDELETGKVAQEEAVRFIIRDSLAKTGAKINQAVALGGAIELATGRIRDFSGKSQSVLELTTAELDLDIQANEWTLAHMVIGHDRGTNVVFPTITGSTASVDRINLDQAFILIGDTQRFPLFAKGGRMVLPFGISTGSAWADTLTTENPLTVEAFEIRKTAIGFGIGFPTPGLKPPTPPVVAPPVRPLVVNPAISAAARRLGYEPPPTRVKARDPVGFLVNPPMFDAGVFFYSGNPDSNVDGKTKPGSHINAQAGYHIRSNCGRSYHELRVWDLCPRAIDLDVSFNTSIFDSRFLESEYGPFLNQIGLIRGGAVALKSSLGPVLLVAEWNSALERARFVDGQQRQVSIKPAAWQVSMGYQFDWNPWVQAIGEQGTYASIAYSQSRDLAGVVQQLTRIDGSIEFARVGFVPRRRIILTAGEWVLDGLRLALEYTYNWDYGRSVGGTGNTSYGLFTTLLYVW